MRPESGSTGANTPNTSTSRKAQMKSGTARNSPLAASTRGGERGTAGQGCKHGDRAAEQARKHERSESELEGGRQPFGQELQNMAVERNRGSEIPVDERADPHDELRWQARVEAVVRAKRRDVGGRCAG